MMNTLIIYGNNISTVGKYHIYPSSFTRCILISNYNNYYLLIIHLVYHKTIQTSLL